MSVCFCLKCLLSELFSQTADKLKSLLGEYIEAHVAEEALLSAVVTDNGANVRKAGTALSGENMTCFCHTAQLALGDFIRGQHRLRSAANAVKVCCFLSVACFCADWH